MDIQFSALQIIILIFSIVLHEVMHGLVALKFGDHTAEKMGRLTLNPIPHIDLFGTILLPLFLKLTGSPIMLAWAKPVPVNPLNFSDIKKGELLVSAAGILANFGLAVSGAILFHLSRILHAPGLIQAGLVYLVFINLILGIFNLFPIPPLDGSKILLSLLPYNLAKEYQKIEKYGFLILVVLMLMPFGGVSLLQTILGFFVNFFIKLLGF